MRRKEITFRVSPFLVSIDGPDGVGKSNFAQVLASKLKGYLSKNKVKLVKPTYFDASRKARRIGQKLEALKKKISPYSKLHNKFFLTAMMVNYREVILPAIESKTLVILDSSEIRALAFIIDKGSPKAIEDTLVKIKKGILTCGIQPKTRIILESSSKDLYLNLNTKKFLDSGDPHGIQEIKRRIQAYRKAISVIQELNECTNWRTINLRHVKGSLKEYHSDFIEQTGVINDICKGTL
ncbi:MAG: hypothetical protein J7K71_00135 [Candidatus Omnitrophica bacterium]|nr:hypothetical protein [Candidatus Omnitrophota bacterium]